MIRTLASSLKIVSIILLALAMAGGSVWFFDYWVEKEQPANRSVVVTVEDDDDPSSMADKLQDEELITYPFYFEQKMQWGSMELNPGTYNLQVGMSTNDILNTIAVSVVAEDDDDGEDDAAAQGPERPEFDVTFIEGQRIEQNAVVLEEAGMPGAASDYVEAAYDIEYWRDAYPMLQDVPADGSLEGFLFPSTYTVPGNATVRNVIDYQLSQFQSNITEEVRAGWEAQGLTVYEAVTVASIVEREAAVPIERPTIAEVYLNRVNDNMNLNADPAQQYGIGTAENWWPELNTELLEQSRQTPYDTYQAENVGLPPGPISNPGAASLQAVAEPSNDGYYYFVTKGDGSGEHRFTYTYEEHQAAMCEEHPDWCE